MSQDTLLAAGFPQLLYSADPTSVEEVLDFLRAIDKSLPANDGLKWWNLLYLITTEQVHQVQQENWERPQWLQQLDVNFAMRYIDALREFYAAKPVSTRAWQSLLNARTRHGVDRIQFALAGMNAHIDYDLALALVKTNQEMGVVASYDCPEYRDYRAVNALFKILIPKTLVYLDSEIWGSAAELTGPLGRLVALLQIEQLRQMAWDASLRLPEMKERRLRFFERMQNNITGAISALVLLPLDPLKYRLTVRIIGNRGVSLLLAVPLRLARTMGRINRRFA